MSQVETIMLVTLGFVVAALLALFIGRMVWSYGVTLGKRRTERSAPATIAGLQAERDQLRAESAMQTRKLELRLDDMKTRLAEQTAEVSRHRNRIDHLAKDIEKRDELVKERDGQIEQLNFHIEPLEAELATRTQAMQQLKEQLRDRDEELSSSTSGQSKFQAQIAERDKEISKLRGEVADREARQLEISTEAESAQERLQGQIRELTALSGHIEKQRSDMSDQLGEFAKPQEDARPADEQLEQEPAAPVLAQVKALTSTEPAVKEAKSPSSKAKPAAKKTKASTKKPATAAKKTKTIDKKAKPAAKKAKPAAKTAKTTTKTPKSSAKTKAKSPKSAKQKQVAEKAKPVAKTDKPAAKDTRPSTNSLRSETDSAKFASEAAKAAARKPIMPARDPRPAAENEDQGSILAAMRKKSIGLSGTNQSLIGHPRRKKNDVDENVNALSDLDDDSNTGQLQQELQQLDAVWAKKIAALNKAAPKTVSTRARAEKAGKALASKAEPTNEDDEPGSSRSRQNVISLAARIRALQKKSAEN